METTTISNRMLSLVALFDLHTGLFPKALVDITDDSAHDRLNTKANHIAWLTGSMVQQRFELAGMLGIQYKQAANELFKDNKGIQDGVRYPSLAGFKNDWEMITPLLSTVLVNVSDEKLDSEIDMGGMKMSFYELITFPFTGKRIA